MGRTIFDKEPTVPDRAGTRSKHGDGQTAFLAVKIKSIPAAVEDGARGCKAAEGRAGEERGDTICQSAARRMGNAADRCGQQQDDVTHIRLVNAADQAEFEPSNQPFRDRDVIQQISQAPRPRDASLTFASEIAAALYDRRRLLSLLPSGEKVARRVG